MSACDDRAGRAARVVAAVVGTFALAFAVAAFTLVGGASADRVADVRGTKHNLSASGPGTAHATSESQVCVFCHTPHSAAPGPLPLWNRALSGATYTPYSSSSIDAQVGEMANGPGGTSRLCLSCHDGTLAIGNVRVANGSANVSIAMTGVSPDGTMPPAAGADTGATRRLGTDLSNDHPISLTLDATLASADGELRTPDGTHVGTRERGVRPVLPLENGQLQCVSCHDPHLRETDPSNGPGKFLRANRFQAQPPGGGAWSQDADIVCLACHDKGGHTYAASAHANPTVADETYATAAAAEREFPTALPVWRASCLNCHDTHTVSGARRLLRNGTDSPTSPKSGGNSAIEETCFQCHTDVASTALSAGSRAPDVESDFRLPYRMPIGLQPEVHDIGTGPGPRAGKDFVESQTLLGRFAPENRHAECTDCHNPHRATRTRRFDADGSVPDTAGTHDHATVPHTNVASGVLRGTVGVEPMYGGAAFGTNPVGYLLKRGDGGVGASSAVGSAWVTREYQVCLKCHSDYAYSTPPDLGDTPGNTASGTNGVTRYTNQAMEFHAPVAHSGETSTADGGAAAQYSTNNHRSWHPVIDATGRSHAVRGTTTAAFVAPWGGGTGVQTMYCSDCHGSSTAESTVVPTGGDGGSPWGPHGSTNPFLLKGEWSSATGTNSRDTGYTSNALCFKCHERRNYASRDGLGDTPSTGFWNSDRGNLHAYHTDKLEHLRCTWCHVAVPHGWKNKSLLVNLNDVGPEAGLAPGTQVRNNTTQPYTNAPYYLNSVLKIRNFARSGSWSESDCGSSGAPGNGESGRDWMRDSSENCASLP